jgi:hypothetical protein
MKKITFYISILVFLFLIYTLINIFNSQDKNLNDYESGFLMGKIILLTTFGFIIYKTNPFKKKDK